MNYHPIDCSFYDRLEHYAVLRKKICIRFTDTDGQLLEKIAVIADLKSMPDGEYFFMDLKDTQPIRLDRLISVDGHNLPGRKSPK